MKFSFKMMNEYQDKTAEELLADEFFVVSIKYPTKESDEFWSNAIRHGIIDASEYQLAVELLEMIKEESDNRKMSSVTQNNIWNRILSSNQRLNKRKKMTRVIRYLAVACVGSLLVIGTWSKYFNSSHTDLKGYASMIKPLEESSDIQLLLADENITTSVQNTVVVHKNGELLINENLVKSNKKVDQSQIAQFVVPRGKRGELILEDGSKLWVNSGSRVVYPLQFKEAERSIFVSGEVYLEVVKNDSKPFIVQTEGMDIKVLGTSFNVMAYEQEKTHSVVLVTGSVEVKTAKNKSKLTPNTMLTYENEIASIKTVNVDNYILWKDGIYKFESAQLSNILDRLSKYYGIMIEYSPKVANLYCSGKLDMHDDLDIILNGLAKTAPIAIEKHDNKYLIVAK